jgi:hypothetical protein
MSQRFGAGRVVGLKAPEIYNIELESDGSHLDAN